MSIEGLLEDHTPAIRQLTKSLRAVILEAMPDAEERIYKGWHAIGFHHPAAGYLCGLFPRAEFVEVVFEHGARLDDPDGLFDSGGSQVRKALLQPGDEVPSTKIIDMIDRAIELKA